MPTLTKAIQSLGISKSKPLFLLFLATILSISIFTSCNMSNENELEEKIENELIPNDWFFRQRAYPQGKINKEAYQVALKERKTLLKEQKTTRDVQPEWSLCGPTNIGGRLVDVEMPLNSMEVIYIGTAAGGIFRSGDLGQTWDAIFDEQSSLAIGDMAIAPSDPNTIYVGTGEANAGGGSLAYDGLGVFKSTTAGASWEDIGLTNVGSIGKVLVDPQNPDRVYVGAMGDLFGENPDRGVFRTTNGGTDWEKVLFLNDSTGVIDMAIHPTNGDIIYAATWERIRRPNRRTYGGPACGIYKSTDGGDTWNELQNNGLPATNVGRIGLAIAPSNPDVLYTIYATESGSYKGVYKSDDAGESWETMPVPTTNTFNFYSSYGWWFGRIFVDPTNQDVLFMCGVDLFKSTDGANSWTNVAGDFIHADQHAVYINPQDPDLVLVGNDGGLYVSETGGGFNSYQHIDGLPITQFYTCEIDEQNPNRIYGGTQDNSSMRTPNGNPNDWETIYFGDGFVVLVNPVDDSYVYTEYQYGNFARSTSGGAPFTFSNATNGISNSDRQNWNTPVVFDPTNPATLYYGSNRLYKSTNHAVSWDVISPDLTNGGGSGNLTFGTLTTIAVSPADNNVVYTGADDGSLHVTTNGGTDWTAVDEDLPNRWITKIEAHPSDPMIAYVTLSGYRYYEDLAHVYKTNDQGASWQNISASLPDVPVNEIILDPENEGWLYIATDIGVFVSFTDGENWMLINDGLPNVPILDLDLHNPTRSIVAATYGRSIYKASLDELSAVDKQQVAIADIDLNIFPNPVTADTKIHLNLAKGKQIEIEIFDAAGKKVQSIFDGFSSTGKHVYSLGDLHSAGTYFCVVKSKDAVISKPFIKAK